MFNREYPLEQGIMSPDVRYWNGSVWRYDRVAMIENLEAMLERGQDSALLRFSLGNAYYGNGDPQSALPHLERALAQDAAYSAAWKLYGRCLTEAGRHKEAVEALDKGIDVAEGRGDIQAAKEMRVFRRRAEKSLASD